MGEVDSSGRDYSRPMEYDLTRNRPNKTLDVGYNGTTVSTDPYGNTLQLSAYHPIHGIILVAPYEQFDKSRYHEVAYVRDYRTRMLQMVRNGDKGFGIRIKDSLAQVAVSHQTMNTAVVSFATKCGIEVNGVVTVHEDGAFTQSITARNDTKQPADLEYTLSLELSVHRASYGQLTEGGPVMPPDCENQLEVGDGGTHFTIYNRLLDGNLAGCLFVNKQPSALAGLSNATSSGVLSGASTSIQSITVQPGSSVDITAWFKLSAGLKPASAPSRPSPVQSQQTVDAIWNDASTCKMYIIRRNIDYILGNCCIPVSENVVGMITDHVALPLGWNRDNYWQWRLLLVARRHLATLLTPTKRDQYRQAIDNTLKGHLRWAFQTAQRPHGFWHRSYIIGGKPKDGPTFQLDQQCYPLLELCDYYRDFPDEVEFVRDILREKAVAEVMELLVSKRDPKTKLYPTDETPGDDVVDHPFHFSSHVLLWHTLNRLAALLRSLGCPASLHAEKTQTLADEVRETALSHFIKTDEASGELRIAYLVDGAEERTLYHDANDIPTVFAAEWGFLTSDRELEAWRNTMKFAISKENKLGYSTGGPFAGLGSVHSQGPWPLGYFQELFYAHLSGDNTAKRHAADRIVGAMQWDGTFGEAVDVETGATSSKAWFSWPGAMIAAALIDGAINI